MQRFGRHKVRSEILRRTNHIVILGCCVLSIVTAIWLLIGHPRCTQLYHTRLSIDVTSGDVLKERFLGQRRIGRSVTRTAFSAKVREYLLVSGPPRWEPMSARYFPDGMREELQFAGALAECRDVNLVIDSYVQRAEDRKAVLRRALELLADDKLSEMRAELEANIARFQKASQRRRL